MLSQKGTFSGTVALGLQAVSCRWHRDYLKAVMVMTEGCGSPVSSVGIEMAVGTAAGRTVGRCSAGPSVGATGGEAGLAAAGLIPSLLG